MKIGELCLDERPREKLVEKGAEALSNAELLAILLRSGTSKMNALEVGRNLLNTSGGSLANLSAMSIERMLSLPGMGIAKAASVVAAFELGRRFAYGKAAMPKIAIKNSSQENSIVIDTFGGSGSTMMACEQTGRICRMMELDPKYASVILRRYVEDFGNADQVFVERSGQRISYSDLVKEVEHE